LVAHVIFYSPWATGRVLIFIPVFIRGVVYILHQTEIDMYLFFFQVSIKEKVFDLLYYFVFHEDLDVQEKALTGLGQYTI